MTTPRSIMTVFTLITMITLAFALATNTPDCNDPHTWGTESGVRHCAVNGGR